eukprot:TRINITY_DN3443_c0_g2_i1.p1 TRINITY_DN3443_c0_g2~~TRINITY_DN3443_c0_g2_i1.p1  ORF type:complete len:188 (-),score=66.61 TRINITY_DN3443_c0_g2_i1:21-584(-)
MPKYNDDMALGAFNRVGDYLWYGFDKDFHISEEDLLTRITHITAKPLKLPPKEENTEDAKDTDSDTSATVDIGSNIEDKDVDESPSVDNTKPIDDNKNTNNNDDATHKHITDDETHHEDGSDDNNFIIPLKHPILVANNTLATMFYVDGGMHKDPHSIFNIAFMHATGDHAIQDLDLAEEYLDLIEE